MPRTIPPARNYQSPLVAVPTFFDKPPREGPKLINCEIDWTNMASADGVVSINLQNNATLEFSQIVALAIDNSRCGTDITFIFPDTSTTITIPAYSPETIVPVFTNMTQFFVQSSGYLAGDVTRFDIHNSLPPPIAVPTTQHQNFVSNGTIQLVGNSTTQLVPLGTTGTLENIDVSVAVPNATADFNYNLSLTDGINVVWQGNVAAKAGGYLTANLCDLNNVYTRFSNGLQLVQLAGAGVLQGTIAISLFYRTP